MANELTITVLPTDQVTLSVGTDTLTTTVDRMPAEVAAIDVIAVEGPAGKPGEKGEQGLQGERGPQGETGEPDVPSLTLLFENGLI